MPVTYQIDKPQGLIRTKCAGAVALEEIVEHFRTLETDPECPDRLNVLLDLSDQTSMPTAEKLRGVVREINRVRARVQFA